MIQLYFVNVNKNMELSQIPNIVKHFYKNLELNKLESW
jgi:hypothetical protein